MKIFIEIHEALNKVIKSARRTSLLLIIFAAGASLFVGGCNRNKGITLEAYNSVTEGMSYKQVVDIIGKEGEQSSVSTAGPAATESERQFIDATVTYTWKKTDNTSMSCIFTDDSLTFKTQIGLK